MCIPGPWKDFVELQASVKKLSGGFLFDGTILSEAQSGLSLVVEGCPRDERMASAFSSAGPHWRGTPEMERISTHQMVIYLVGEGCSPKKARNFMKAAAALIHSGGLGVKIESTGLAYSPVDWLRMADEVMTEHRAFVVYITGDDTFSCGMHNLGLRDAIIAAEDSEDPAELLRIFTRYQFYESPNTQEGHTFSVDANAPRYRLFVESNSPYGPESLFHNPYGMWRLKLIN